MKIYVTKYALTKRGILEFDTEKGDVIVCSGCFYNIYHNRHWNSFNKEKETFPTREEAISAAQTMRADRLRTLYRTINRIENLDWSEQ
jgi:hypothetical protein